MNILLGNIINNIHHIIVLFIYTGGYILPEKYLKYYLLFVILLPIHWKINKNKCILTEWENKLKNIKGIFVPRFFEFYGIKLKNYTLLKNILVSLSVIAAVKRLIKIKDGKISIKKTESLTKTNKIVLYSLIFMAILIMVVLPIINNKNR